MFRKVLSASFSAFLKTKTQKANSFSKIPKLLFNTPQFYFSQTKTIQSIQANLQKLKQEKGENTEEVASMLLELASEYAHKGQTLSAVDNYKKCSDIIKNIYGEQHANYLSSLRKTCELTFQLREYQKALEFALKLKDLQAKFVDPKDSHHIATANQIGMTYKQMKNHEQARKWLEKALSMQSQFFGQKTRSYAILLIQIARLDLEDSKIEDGFEKYKKGLALFKQIDFPEEQVPIIQNAYFDLATIYHFAKRDKASAKEQISEAKKIINLSKQDFISAYMRVFQGYAAIDQIHEGISALKECLEHVEKNQGKNLAYSSILTSIGTAYHMRNQNIQALPFLQQAKQIYIKHNRKQDVDWALLLFGLGTVKASNGNFKEGVVEMNEGLETWKYLGQTHINHRAAIKSMLGKTYYQLHDFNKAAQAFEGALNDEKVIEKDSGIVFNTHSYLSTVYYALQKFNLSLDHALECNRIGKNKKQFEQKVQGELVPFIIQLLFRQGRLNECPSFLQRQETFLKKLPENDPRWFNYYEKVGTYHEFLQQAQKSVQAYEKARQLMNKNAQKNEESEKRIEALNQRIDNLKGKLK